VQHKESSFNTHSSDIESRDEKNFRKEKRYDDNLKKRDNQPHKKDQRQRKERKVTVILGNSMVKDLRGWHLSNQHNQVVVKPFLGAKIEHMKWHTKPTVFAKPDNIILHFGTNSINKDVVPDIVANDIIKEALEIQKESGSQVMISGIVPRNSNLNKKVIGVNKILKDECSMRNIGFLPHDNICPKNHCTRRGLHLNKEGGSILSDNFTDFLSSLNSEE